MWGGGGGGALRGAEPHAEGVAEKTGMERITKNIVVTQKNLRVMRTLERGGDFPLFDIKLKLLLNPIAIFDLL